MYDHVLWNASYNRYGWAFFCIFILVVALPRLKGADKRAYNVDGVLAGFLLFILFYMKATYSLVGIGLLAVSMLTVRRSYAVRYGAVTLATLLFCMLMIEVVSGIGPYLAELRRVAAAQPDRIRLAQLILITQATYYDAPAVFFIGLCAVMLSGLIGSPLGKSALLLVLAIVAVGVVAAAQNHIAFEIPTIPVAALIASLLFWQLDIGARSNRTWHGILCVAVALVFVKPMLLDGASLIRAARRTAEHTPDSAWLRDTALHDLVVRHYPNSVRGWENTGPFCCEGNDSEYLYVLLDGVELLRRHMSAPATVFSLTWSNPFPTLLGLPPVKHNLICVGSETHIQCEYQTGGRRFVQGRRFCPYSQNRHFFRSRKAVA